VLFVWPLLGKVEDEVRDGQVATALEAFARAGITGLVEMALEEPALESMVRLQAAGRLTARIIGHMII
jgi:hypothetical protein